MRWWSARFLILNTFSIIVAQRTRELALFRALGASKAQVTRSVLLEALVVGLVGSTVGLALGFGLAAGLQSLFGSLGIDLGSAGLVFEPRTVMAAYAVGVVVTLLAAYLPARKAARVPPVAAMRDDVAIPESSMHRRLIGGAALTVLGAGLMIWALAFDGGLQPLGGGVLAVFVGVALLSPVISRPIIATIAGGYPRMFGTVGVLAKENARRNPRRTAATASALMIGLALVTTMAMLGQSTKSSVDELVKSDLLGRLRRVECGAGTVLPGDRARDRRGARSFRGCAVPVRGGRDRRRTDFRGCLRRTGDEPGGRRSPSIPGR